LLSKTDLDLKVKQSTTFCRKKTFPLHLIAASGTITWLKFSQVLQKTLMRNRFFSLFLFFVSLWLIFSIFSGPDEQAQPGQGSDITIETKDEWVEGQLVTFTITNNTESAITLSENTNPPQSLTFERQNSDGDWEQIELENRDQAATATVIPADDSLIVSYSAWNNQLFSSQGSYRVLLETAEFEAVETFEVTRPGFFRSAWRTILFKPIFNILIFFITFLPGHNLALGILALTILIKLILLVPSKKALIQQQKMQKVQVELDSLKKKYANDQQKLAQETMALWKKHNINPVGTFLPMFAQFPVMIALFFVVKEGLQPHNQAYLYDFFSDFNLELVSQNIWGILDLSQNGVWWLALIVAGLQFASMKLNLVVTKKKQPQKGKKGKNTNDKAKQMQSATQIMAYILPLLIGFFTLNTPAAVGFYWGVSTLFSLGQQVALNKEHLMGDNQGKIKITKE
jgi:YidC/Oxa1 family membrane protein insertase